MISPLNREAKSTASYLQSLVTDSMLSLLPMVPAHLGFASARGTDDSYEGFHDDRRASLREEKSEKSEHKGESKLPEISIMVS